ncbi:hypothetical protein JAO76_15580 [Pontibacter sp. BT310]|uniref:Uncharacterized protein n=2 Tax=Hymenobacteraceae TaxID=1853232 RepID=A0ABS6XET6_9BACT|nr:MULTISPECIES: hypothetical protein [Pontibacter]MBJ6119631.1 hypothetical protein [Pontibacter sp. BT310]MBR0572058.1 hypothetical protein [Microvirga sp. STS03]MBW3366484.1 hypothetical protein [Pontibacter populi]
MSSRKLEHSKPNGKVAYIQRAECDRYVRQNTIRTIEEINQEAAQRIKKGGRSW